MLKLLNGTDNPILNVDNFYIEELWSGLDELVFDIPVTDPGYKAILEESVVEYEQPYLVKAVDGGSTSAKIKCQLDVDELKADMLISYSNGSDTVIGTIEGVLPAGWAAVDHAYISNRRTVELEAGTPLDIIQKCADTYSVVIRYDIKNQQVHVWDPDSFEPLGAFASRDLNLQEVNYKGKSSDFATRLYGYGKDGLTVASINGGLPYVENKDYADKIISVYWKDDRYTVAENLLADMKKKLKEMAVPTASYSCSVMDLAKTNPELYAHQDFSLMQVIRLVDSVKGAAVNHQVVQYRRYPFYPEKNVITLSTVAPSIQSTVKQLQYNQDNPSSPFRQQMQAAIQNATEKITFADKGYVILPTDADGNITEMLVMNTMSKETATKVWRWNLGGLGYSDKGYNGPYGTAITMDGAIVANYITAGTMLCDRVRGGTLILGGASNGNGVFQLQNAAGSVIARMDNTGLAMSQGSINLANNFIVTNAGRMTAKSGYIGNGAAGWTIANSAIYNGCTSIGDTRAGTYIGTNGIRNYASADSFTTITGGKITSNNVDLTGKITATSGYIGGNEITQEHLEVKAQGGLIVANTANICMRDVQGELKAIIRPYTYDNNPNLAINAMGNILYLGAFDTPNGIYAMEGMFYDNGQTYISSDRRLKDDIEEINPEESLDFVRRLHPVSFRYTGKPELHHGLIAQEVQAAIDGKWDVVTEYEHMEDRETGRSVPRLTLAYMELIADLAGAIQAIDRRVEYLWKNQLQ